jgi:hypothetical protein
MSKNSRLAPSIAYPRLPPSLPKPRSARAPVALANPRSPSDSSLHAPLYVHKTRRPQTHRSPPSGAKPAPSTDLDQCRRRRLHRLRPLRPIHALLRPFLASPAAPPEATVAAALSAAPRDAADGAGAHPSVPTTSSCTPAAYLGFQTQCSTLWAIRPTRLTAQAVIHR